MGAEVDRRGCGTAIETHAIIIQQMRKWKETFGPAYTVKYLRLNAILDLGSAGDIHSGRKEHKNLRVPAV
ncbi:hypothetical protein CHARACLAT_024238 [Characodon lateralis]|uniref:Uncharacterized protein n=1 Tax=Characodon lateralis TaxID=208331 RepID=A0ABU7CRA3_9TELE|nr:hypothetical protein [Characodon lateralis]